MIEVREKENLAPLVDKMRSDVDSIVRDCIRGHLKRHPSYFSTGDMKGAKGGSLVIWRTPWAKAGQWREYNERGVVGRDRGDILHLVSEARFNGNMGEAIRWAKDKYGWTEDPAIRKKWEQESETRREEADKEAKAESDERAKKAKGRWLNASPVLLGTAADDYLLARSIDLRQLTRRRTKDGPLEQHTPGALRFEPDYKYWEVRTGPDDKPVFTVFHRGPCILAAIQNAEGQHIATHRIWTGLKIDEERDPMGDAVPVVVARGPDKATRKAYGDYRGGYIRVWVPDKRRPLKKCGPGDVVTVAEGVEDALANAIARPEWHHIAAVGLSNLLNLDLPCAPGVRLIMCKDKDWSNPAATATFQNAVDRQIDVGHDVRVFVAPTGKDSNDTLRGFAA